MDQELENGRIDEFIEALAKVAAGDYSIQAPISGKNDALDSLAMGLNMMIDDLNSGTVKLDYVDKRINGILKVVREVARGNYGSACELGEELDNFDALAMGLNMMIEDIDRSRETLKQSEENLWATLNSIGDGVIACDAEARISFLNPVAENLTGWTREEAAGRPMKEIFKIVNEKTGGEVENPVDRVLKEGKIVGLANHTVLIAKDGRRIPIDDSGAPIKNLKGDITGAVLVFRDITQRRQLEEEKRLRQERLAQLGQLAGGVGHELRNPLGAIKNSIYFMNMVLEEADPEIKETLQIIENEITNSEKIIASLLDFARPAPPLKRRVNVRDIIRERLTRLPIPAEVAVKDQLGESLPVIMADPHQLEQVFDNIILNAVQAMSAGGVLTISGRAADAGKNIAVSFSDTGPGIPAEDIKKIFTPLFTGKAKGIGLGLPIARTFVEGHGGGFHVESEVGKGSVFTVTLPVIQQP